MPLYDYRCICGNVWEVMKPLAQLDTPESCPKCAGVATERILSAPRILADYAGYSCPVTGKWIEGRKAHRENLALHGCRLLEPGEKEANLARRARSDAELEANVASTVEQEIHAMPAVKRDRLVAELEHGLDLTITRS